ncbi:MAG: methylmalonyl Co-A mutase-associated GTPase MeaB [Geminicoccales bacterium]
MNADPKRLANKILSGDRRSLARGITLIESARPDHQEQAQVLVEMLLPHTGHAIRLGITGTPGAGKSTFIEAFGIHVIGESEQIAVLAVDPSSQRSGGSILGDKTRMQRLSLDRNAYIRPSPAGMTLGGVARKTREAAILCEAAGFSVIVLETVGVGQSETTVADMVDCFLLLLAPGAGDELQGIKRGIIETADLVLVNKADGDLLATANLVQSDYQAALHLLRPASPSWTPEVLTCSALKGDGIDQVWKAIKRHRQALEKSSELQAKRQRQHQSWFWSEVQASLIDALQQDPKSTALMRDLEDQINKGTMLPPEAARRLIRKFRAKADTA